MSMAKGFCRADNAQAGATRDQVIVAAAVTDEQNAVGPLHPVIAGTTGPLETAGIDARPERS